MNSRNNLKLPMLGPQRTFKSFGAFVIWGIIIFAVLPPFWDFI